MRDWDHVTLRNNVLLHQVEVPVPQKPEMVKVSEEISLYTDLETKIEYHPVLIWDPSELLEKLSPVVRLR